jgi:MFS family permease
MDGVAGKPGWAWIFILEGIFTVLCALASFWIIQDFPEAAKFLSEEESEHQMFEILAILTLCVEVFIIRRLRADMQFSAGGERFQFKYVVQSLKDWKTYLAMG